MCTNLMLSLPNVVAPGTSAPADPKLYVSARCMEMPNPVETAVYVVPSKQSFPLAPPPFPVASPAPWTNRYGFVAAGNAMPGFGTSPTFIDGINTEGLSAAALWLPGTVYTASGPPNAVSYLDFVGWILGNFALVEDLEAQLDPPKGSTPAITVVGPQQPAVGAADTDDYAPLHFIATDSTGASLIVEFVDGHVTTYQSSNGVMTNAPIYDWQLTNIANYAGMTPVGSATAVHAAAGAVPVGGGQLGMPGDATSQSRFVKAWLTTQGINTDLPSSGDGWLPAPDGSGYSYATQTAVTTALQLVQAAMTTPYGMLLMPDKQGAIVPGDFTQWTSVRDHTNATYYFAAAFTGILSSIQLDHELFANAPSTFPGYWSVALMPQADGPWCAPVTFGS